MRHAADTQSATHTAKVEPGHPDYPEVVAKPMMGAVDSMPAEYRLLVHEYGYGDIYRAWRRGWTVEQIKSHVTNGRFELR